MRINREEMFAPLAAVIKVDSFEEALAVVNDTDFGLTSGIVTQSLARATLLPACQNRLRDGEPDGWHGLSCLWWAWNRNRPAPVNKVSMPKVHTTVETRHLFRNATVMRIDALQYCPGQNPSSHQMREGGVDHGSRHHCLSRNFREMVARIENGIVILSASRLIFRGSQRSASIRPETIGPRFSLVQNPSPIEDDIGLVEIVLSLGNSVYAIEPQQPIVVGDRL